MSYSRKNSHVLIPLYVSGVNCVNLHKWNFCVAAQRPVKSIFNPRETALDIFNDFGMGSFERRER